MEKIISNPGLQHLAEKVFWNLDVEDLKICAQINQSCKQILQNPIFCLRKFENLSKKNQKDSREDSKGRLNQDSGTGWFEQSAKTRLRLWGDGGIGASIHDLGMPLINGNGMLPGYFYSSWMYAIQ